MILSDIAEYVTERVNSKSITLNQYVTTDSLLQNKRGRQTAQNLPPMTCALTRYCKGDILISNIRPYLKKIWLADSDGGCSTDVLAFRAKNGHSPNYLYALLMQDAFFQYMMQGSKGSKMPRGDKNQIMHYSVPTFSSLEEANIGTIIVDIERKIQINRQINDNLEAMAKQLYDYWFVQFDFPNEEGKPYKSSGGKMIWKEKLKREIPESWEVDALNKWLEIKSGFPFKSETYLTSGHYKVITIKNVQDGELVTSGCDFVDEIPSRAKDYISLQIGDRLISLTGNCGRLCVVCEKNLLLNQRVGLLYCDKLYLEYLYNYLNSQPMRIVVDHLANGAAQANLSPVELCNTMCAMPQESTLREYNQKANVIRLAMIQNNQEIATLTKQRDELLPLLMNGQVSVNYHLSDD
jgi:type I restriction enzyme S subunit